MRAISTVVVLCLALLGSSTTTRAEPDRVRVGVQVGILFLPYHVADRAGLFAKRAREAGLGDVKLEITRVSNANALNDQLFSGNLDLAAHGIPGFLIAWDKTRGRMDLMGLHCLMQTPMTLLSNNPALKRVSDLSDSDRVAMTSTVATQAVLLRMAAEKAFGTEQFTRFDKLIASMPNVEAVNALLNKTEVTAYFSVPPFTALLLRNSSVHVVTTAEEIVGEPMTANVVTTPRKFAEDNPKTIRVLIEAIEESMQVIQKDRRRAAEIYRAVEAEKMSIEEIEAVLAEPGNRYVMEPRGLTRMAHFMNRIGMIKGRPDSWKDLFLPYIRDRDGS